MLNIIRHGLVEIQCDQCSQLFIAAREQADIDYGFHANHGN